MATRRDTARAHEQSDPATVSHTDLLPALREYRSSDLQPPTARAHAQSLLALADHLDQIEDTQAPAGPTLQ